MVTKRCVLFSCGELWYTQYMAGRTAELSNLEENVHE